MYNKVANVLEYVTSKQGFRNLQHMNTDLYI